MSNVFFVCYITTYHINQLFFGWVAEHYNIMNTASKLGPHTQTDRGTCHSWGSEFTSKDAALQRGVTMMLMPLFAAALVVRRRYFIVAPRPFLAAPLVVRRRCLIVVPMPVPEAPHMYLIVVYRPFPAAPLVVRCMYMAVVPGPMPASSFAVLSMQVSTVGLRLRLVVPRPMPAAVASRWCRRRFQQLACA